ncbi:MAG: NAD(P)H-dependent glycerol-3-phosphate dehydrogenase [Rhodobacterales bacterium]
MSIAIIGIGAFGTALAFSLSQKNADIILWGRNPQQMDEICAQRENTAKLAGAILPPALNVTSDFDHAMTAQTLLLAVPMQTLRALALDRAEGLRGKILVACCKGIEQTTNLGPLAVLAETVPNCQMALLTGPSFAHDIAAGLPTALTLACADDELGVRLQYQLTTSNLRLYRCTDTIGAELGGAIKNVIAIACGAAVGAGLGDSARVALMTRGYAEMQRMALPLGARLETLAGLSGFGDLALTCSTKASRNYRFGVALGQGANFDPTIIVEGAATARAALQRAGAIGIDMPITAAVVALLDGKIAVAKAMDMLLSRPLKEE